MNGMFMVKVHGEKLVFIIILSESLYLQDSGVCSLKEKFENKKIFIPKKGPKPRKLDICNSEDTARF